MKATISNFGPFEKPTVFELNLSLPVSEVRGYNGAGKSTLLTTIRRALGDDSAVPTRTRGTTGPAEFILEQSGQSITLRLGTNFTPKNKAALAAFPVQLATKDSSQLEALVGPDDQSESASDAARARRLVALASIARIEPTPQNLAFMASDLDVPLDRWKSDNIAAIRLELYSRLIAKAKDYNSTADQHVGIIKSIEAQLAGLPTVDPGITARDADAAAEQARRQPTRLEDSHTTRLQMEKERAAASADLPAPQWGGAFRDAGLLIKHMEEREPCAANLSSMMGVLNSIRAGLEATQREVAAYNAVKAILDRPITGATQEEVDAAKTALNEALKVATHARAWASRLEIAPRLTTAREAEVVARAAAKKYETAAKTIPARLATLIQQAGLTDFSVDDDGEIVVKVNGEWFPYALRSRSERVTAAIVLVASQVKPIEGKLSLILVPDTLWTSLDSSHRESLEFQLEPYAGNVHILTEAPTMDSLEVSHPLA